MVAFAMPQGLKLTYLVSVTLAATWRRRTGGTSETRSGCVSSPRVGLSNCRPCDPQTYEIQFLPSECGSTMEAQETWNRRHRNRLCTQRGWALEPTLVGHPSRWNS